MKQFIIIFLLVLLAAAGIFRLGMMWQEIKTHPDVTKEESGLKVFNNNVGSNVTLEAGWPRGEYDSLIDNAVMFGFDNSKKHSELYWETDGSFFVIHKDNIIAERNKNEWIIKDTIQTIQTLYNFIKSPKP